MNEFLIVILICLIVFPIIIYYIQKNNLKHYKLVGRTPIEIECWLKTRKWYKEFIDEITLEEWRDIKDGMPQDIDKRIDYIKDEEEKICDKVNEYISGLHDKDTISTAFYWPDTKKGTEYWGKREYEFLKWYFGQYIDLHLFK